MNETLLWFLYVLSAAAAFAAVFRLGWKIVPAMLAGTAVTLLGWLLMYLTAKESRPAFWEVDLSLNASFALIFAGAGAALGFFRRGRTSV